MSDGETMKARPQKQHEWLHCMIGDWDAEIECDLGPDQPPTKSTGTESVRSLGGLWVVAEAEGETPDGDPSKSIMTLGYDPQKDRFVGTFIASVMSNMWVYDGTLDAGGKVLTLDTEGPDFTGGPELVKYQDVVEILSDDHRTMKSFLHTSDGDWKQFVTVNYRRRK